MERNAKCLQGQEREYGGNIKQVHTYYKEVFESPKIDLALLPAYSFVIHFTFMLAQPYISHDEQDFYIIDNPVRKDKIFGLPYVASTSWKGSLRAALWQQGKKAEDDIIRHLFGNEKETKEQEHFRAGRLYFFPTFFNIKDLEIINPQDHLRRIGTLPIVFETVPENTEGIFTLLYVPFDLIGKNEQENRMEVAGDLQLVADGLQAMFRTYGFGAKTSSGFGLAREDISGSLTLRISRDQRQKEAETTTVAQPALPPLPRYLVTGDRLKPEYLTSEGTFRERSESELKKMSKVDRQLYEKAKGWWERWSKKQVEATKVPEHVEPALLESLPPAQPISWPKREFNSFEQLTRVVEKLAEQLKGGLEES